MPAAKRSISSRVTIQNPRPRKYASAAERQKALRERFPTLCVRVEQEQADFMKRIADEQGRTLQDVHLAFIKYANGRGNLWLTQGLKGFAPLPRFEEPPKENPTMKRKPTPAQIAARERFAEMARSGAFKKAAKRNPAKKTVSKKVDLQAWMDEYERLENENMHSENAVRLADLLGTKTDQQIARQIVKNHERLGYLDDDDYDRRRDIYKRLTPKLERLLEPKSNPRASNPIVLVTDRKPSKRKANPVKRKVMKEKRPFYYVVKVGQSYDGQFSSEHYSLEDVKKIAQQKADKYGAQAKITELH